MKGRGKDRIWEYPCQERSASQPRMMPDSDGSKTPIEGNKNIWDTTK